MLEVHPVGDDGDDAQLLLLNDFLLEAVEIEPSVILYIQHILNVE